MGRDGTTVNEQTDTRRNGARGEASTDERAVFTTKQAARYLNLGAKEVTRMFTTGELPAWKTSTYGDWRVAKSDCDQWIENQRVRAAAERAALATDPALRLVERTSYHEQAAVDRLEVARLAAQRRALIGGGFTQ